jgi:dihydrofolate synthase / folylpolyglutamate synthase
MSIAQRGLPGEGGLGEAFAMNVSVMHVTYGAVLAQLSALGASKMRLGIDRIQAVLAALGNPQDTLPVIHVVGTNGKGSTSAITASIYKAAGYKVGLFTSPHLMDVRERIQINGQPVSQEAFVQAAEPLLAWMQHHPQSDTGLTYFEALTVIGFLAFTQARCEVVILEAGLGGRLDSTNVVAMPLATVVTPISYDHQHLLGETLTQIAQEKCAVFRPNVPVIAAYQSEGDEPLAVIRDCALKTGSPLLLQSGRVKAGPIVSTPTSLGRQFESPTIGAFVSPLLGAYQAVNIETALAVVEQLQEVLPVSQAALKTAMQTVGWPGRMHVLWPHRLIIDGSHNAQGMAALVPTLRELKQGLPLTVALAVSATKDLIAVAQAMKALNPKQIVLIAGLGELQGREFILPAVLEAALVEAQVHCPISTQTLDAFMPQALAQAATTQEWVLIAGSLYLAGAAYDTLRHNRPQLLEAAMPWCV